MFIQYWGDSALCPSKSWQKHISSFFFCSSLRTATLQAGVSPDKEVMQASASTAEGGCLGTPWPLPRGRIACENKHTHLYKGSREGSWTQAHKGLVNLGHKFVLGASDLKRSGLPSVCVSRASQALDLLMSVADRIIQWPLPHWRICKVSLQLPGLKRLRDLIIFGTSVSQIQWKSANRLWNYGKVEWTNTELQEAPLLWKAG